MREKLRVGCLVLIAAAFALPTHADTITTYTINFTTTSGSPTPLSGSFTYDSTTPLFTDFLVTWNGNTFNLTAEANSPTTGSSGCLGEASSPAYGFSMMSTSLNCGGLTSFVWSGFAGEGTGGAGIFDFIVGTTVGDDFISAGGIGSGTPTASGTYAIVATPEAATYSLMLVGCLTILIFSGHRETSLCRPNPRDTRSRTGKRLENSQVSEDGRSISGH
jgi:hypothetical protein